MDEAYQYLLNKLEDEDAVVAAISGGPDSMALLHLLSTIKEKKKISIICAHVNHNLRQESYDEKIMVEEFCKKRDVIFESMIIEKYGKQNFHKEARDIRYNYFEELIKKYNAKYLITAHHGDDLMETVLMRIVRGSTLKGYSGFSKELVKDSYTILRPFIEVTKLDLEKYNNENNIEYAIDKSNFKDVYTRNRYRKYILPVLKNENPNVHKKFYKFSKNVIACSDYIQKQVNDIVNKIYVNDILDLKEFNKLDEFMAKQVINNILENKYNDNIYLVTEHHVDLIYELIKSSKSNSSISLPLNIELQKRYDKVIFNNPNLIKGEYLFEIKEEVKLPNGHIITTIDNSESDSNFICRLNKNDVKFPLYIRNKKTGDKIILKGMNKSKKIKDIFINEKVDKDDRKLWPVVVDSNNVVVWLPGLKKSKFDKTKEENYDIILKYC